MLLSNLTANNPKEEALVDGSRSMLIEFGEVGIKIENSENLILKDWYIYLVQGNFLSRVKASYAAIRFIWTEKPTIFKGPMNKKLCGILVTNKGLNDSQIVSHRYPADN